VLVAEVLSKRGRKRIEGLIKLNNIGSFSHNVKVLRKGCGDLIVMRRSGATHRISEDYLPCPHCYGFYFSRDLWKHVRQSCSVFKNSSDESTGHIVVPDSSQSLLDGAINANNNRKQIDQHQ
jgi:hypothetical protein